MHTRCSYLSLLICNTALKQQKSLELPNCFFPNLNNSTETRVPRWFTAAPLKVALGIAGLATHGRNKLVQGASADPTLSFVPFSQFPTLDDQLSRFAKLLQKNLVPPRQAKLCAKACFSGRLSIRQKTRLINAPHQKQSVASNFIFWTYVLCGQYIYRSSRRSQEGS